MSAILNQLSTLPALWAYAVIATLVLAEAALFIGFVLPGETAVLIGGALAATGQLTLAPLLILVVVAAVVGDSIGYEVGRKLGPRLLTLRPMARHLERIERARESIRTRGGLAVLIGRSTAFLRAVMPALAGLSRMPYRTFLLYNALGALLWGVAITLLGYFAGHSLPRVERALGRGGALLAAVLLALLLVALHRRRRRT